SEGMIDFGPMTRAVEQAGYRGDIEVELFHAEIWADEPAAVAARTARGFAAAVAPHLADSSA
ncbi:MAG: hypothetical protein Q7V19_07335, partial [Bacteroidales bacterium]|nr:hypothetical protein [Bacteroidales bacterium]